MPEPLPIANTAAWLEVVRTLRATGRAHRVVPADRERGMAAAASLALGADTPMGEVVRRSAAILLAHGWLRILGSGGELVGWGVAEWSAHLAAAHPGIRVVAVDVLGGVFALGGVGLPGPSGHVCYFGPDVRDWEPLGLSYRAFLSAMSSDRSDRFYLDMRWPGWAAEVARLPLDQGWWIEPALHQEGPPLEERTRRQAALVDIWRWLTEPQPETPPDTPAPPTGSEAAAE